MENNKTKEDSGQEGPSAIAINFVNSSEETAKTRPLLNSIVGTR